MALKRISLGLYKYESSGVYFAHVRASGKLHRKSLRTTDRKLADRRLSEFRRKISRIDTRLGRITLAAMADLYLQTIEHRSHSTKKARRGIIARLKNTFHGADSLSLGEIKPSQLETWLSKQAGHLSASHYNTFVTTLRDIFALAVRDRYIADSPCAEFKYRKRKQPIRLTPSWEQFKAIVADVRSQPFNADALDSADFLEACGVLGLGQAELAGMKREHIDLKRGRIIVYRRKTDTGFVVPVFPQARALIKRLCEGKKHDAYLFPIAQARKALRNSCTRLGFPNFGHRSLRRTFVTKALESGADVGVVAAWQGHRDQGALILRTYRHLRSEHAERMARLMR
jgi:integrase